MAQAPQTSAPAPQTPPAGPPQTPAAPLPTLEQSFELLKEFKLGTDSTGLIPIERAVMEAHGNETARAALEKCVIHIADVQSDPGVDEIARSAESSSQA